MTLRGILEQLDEYDDDSGVYLAGLASLDSSATVIESVDGELPETQGDMHLLMEVWHVRDTLDGLKSLLVQQHTSPSPEQLYERFVLYLHNDA